MAFALDFHRPQRPLSRAPLWARTLLFLGALATLGLAAGEASSRYGQRQQLEERLSALRQELGKTRPAVEASVLAGKKAQTQLAAQYSAPWESMFLALEKSLSADIALLGLSAERGAEELILRGEAKNLPALKVFVDALSRETVFRQLILSNHKLRNSSDETVSFEVRARWH